MRGLLHGVEHFQNLSGEIQGIPCYFLQVMDFSSITA